jgi:small membrane protein
MMKWALAALTTGSMLYFFVLSRRSSSQRLFVIAFFGSGLALVVSPELANRIAHSVGIGRGADLITYLSTLFLFFIVFNLYLRIKAQDQRTTKLARALALAAPVRVAGRVEPGPPSSHSP